MEFLEDNKADGIKLKTKQTKSNWKKALVIDGSFKRIDYHKFFYLSSAKKKKKKTRASMERLEMHAVQRAVGDIVQ